MRGGASFTLTQPLELPTARYLIAHLIPLRALQRTWIMSCKISCTSVLFAYCIYILYCTCIIETQVLSSIHFNKDPLLGVSLTTYLLHLPCLQRVLPQSSFHQCVSHALHELGRQGRLPRLSAGSSPLQHTLSTPPPPRASTLHNRQCSTWYHRNLVYIV